MKVCLSAIFAALILVSSATYAQNGSSTAASPSSPAAAPSSSKRPPVFRPTKDQISEVQKILKEKKLYTGEASGKYDDSTRAGIKMFQKGNGLRETGTLNRATLEKFGVALTDTQKAIPVSPNSFAKAEQPKTDKPNTEKPDNVKSSSGRTIFRATTDQIKSAQKLLKDKSLYAGDQNGKLDDATREGLKKYQDANGLKVTGTLNQATLEKMGIDLTDKQKAAATTENKPK